MKEVIIIRASDDSFIIRVVEDGKQGPIYTRQTKEQLGELLGEIL